MFHQLATRSDVETAAREILLRLTLRMAAMFLVGVTTSIAVLKLVP